MTIKEAVVKRLNDIMKERNLTQYQLCLCTGLPQSTISTIFSSATKSVSIKTIFEICSGLNIELCDFFDIKYFKLENLFD